MSVDGDRVVLDCRDTRHLNGSLQSASDEDTAEAGHVGEEFFIGFGFVVMVERDTLLNLVELSPNPRVILVAVAVELGECFQTEFGFVVVKQPAWGFGEEEDEGSKHDGGNNLDTEGNAPLSSVGVDIECSPADP